MLGDLSFCRFMQSCSLNVLKNFCNYRSFRALEKKHNCQTDQDSFDFNMKPQNKHLQAHNGFQFLLTVKQ